MDYVKYIRDMVGHKAIIMVGSVVILHKDKHILLQKRIGDPIKWGLPGGLMEMGESTEETARREVFEETALTIGKLNLVDIHSGPQSFIKVSNGDEFYSVAIAYETSDYEGEICIDKSESLDFKYFEFSKLPKNMVASHLKLIQSFLNRG